MLQFIYRGDYDTGGCPYGYASRAGTQGISCESDSDHSVKEALSHVRDNRLDAEHLPEQSLAEEVGGRPSEAGQTNSMVNEEVDGEPEHLSMSNDVLNLHAKMFALGDKYQMKTLMSQALRKFNEDASQLQWDDDAVLKAIHTIFSSAPPEDERLVDAVVDILHHRERGEGLSRVMGTHIESMGALSFRLYKREQRKERGPHCWACGRVLIKQCPGRSGFGRGSLFDCEQYFVTCKCSDMATRCRSCS